MTCDVLIVGAGVGGTAAAIALQGSGLRVVVTEPTGWIGGQLTSQMVPPDEHPWIEQFGSSARYREFRERVRAVYRRSGGLTAAAAGQRFLNPGGGWVSRLCAEPRAYLQALEEMVAGSDATWLMHHVPIAAETHGDLVTAVRFLDQQTGDETTVEPRLILEASETGDLYPLAGIEYRLGSDARSMTGEPHAAERADPEDVQGLTWCAAVGYDPDGDHTIDRPAEYDRWRAYAPACWCGPLLSETIVSAQTGEPTVLPAFGRDGGDLFTYRRIVDPAVWTTPTEAATVVNWPQNDYFDATVLDVTPERAAERLESARQLTLSVLYWAQTELGHRGLRLRPDLSGTDDGLAMAPYIREGRRLVARATVTEHDVSAALNPGADRGPVPADAVATGAYRIDLHPSASGAGIIDLSAVPFTVPLGALLPVRVRNVIAAGKGFGVTHIANGATRLHPVEWSVGEAAGTLAAFALLEGPSLDEVVSRPEAFLSRLRVAGLDTQWPRLRPL